MRLLNLTTLVALSCVSGSSSKSNSLEDTNSATVVASCDTDPVGITPQYSCDSTDTTGQCVDYLESFDTSTMDTTCTALQGNAALSIACDVPDSIGRCCQLLNGQWFVTHYAQENSSGLEANDLQSFCESGGGIWY